MRTFASHFRRTVGKSRKDCMKWSNMFLNACKWNNNEQKLFTCIRDNDGMHPTGSRECETLQERIIFVLWAKWKRWETLSKPNNLLELINCTVLNELLKWNKNNEREKRTKNQTRINWTNDDERSEWLGKKAMLSNFISIRFTLQTKRLSKTDNFMSIAQREKSWWQRRERERERAMSFKLKIKFKPKNKERRKM